MVSLEKVFDLNPNPIFVVELITEGNECKNFRYLKVNQAFSILLGISKNELQGNTFLDFFPEGEKTFLELFYDTVVYKRSNVMTNVSALISKKMVIYSYPVGKNACACEILEISTSDDKEYQAELWHKANTDFLTGLYNRNYLYEYIAKISNSSSVGLFMMDINNLKIVNDTKGHKEGDALLVNSVELFRKLFPTATLFRTGGDEFIGIIPNVEEELFLDIMNNALKEFNSTNLSSLGYKYLSGQFDIEDHLDEVDALMYKHKYNQKHKQ